MARVSRSRKKWPVIGQNPQRRAERADCRARKHGKKNAAMARMATAAADIGLARVRRQLTNSNAAPIAPDPSAMTNWSETISSAVGTVSAPAWRRRRRIPRTRALSTPKAC